MGMVESSTFQQKLNIGNWCTSIGTILHEIAHSLGQAHEQSRPDRDDSVKIDMTNVRAGKEGNFTKSSTAYTAMPYDYGSIMQYSAFSFAKDNSKPTVKPINCEPNCPPISSLGANTGFTLLDQKQAADMYHCTKEQMAIRSDKIECVDWVTDPQKQPLDCAAYKAAGKCATDKRPCCSCGEWDSGMKQRKWITKVSVADCKDKY
jgi:meprin B